MLTTYQVRGNNALVILELQTSAVEIFGHIWAYSLAYDGRVSRDGF